jgi:MerR family redox-sensitive transcriptional activator SoxR
MIASGFSKEARGVNVEVRFKSRGRSMSDMTIGEVAKAAQLRTSTIRYYEKVGLLPAPIRVSGQRRYDHRILERLAIVRFAQRVGFRIAEIRVLLRGFEGRPPPERWRLMATQKLSEVDQLIHNARAIRASLEESLRHKCPKLVERGRQLTAHRASQGSQRSK